MPSKKIHSMAYAIAVVLFLLNIHYIIAAEPQELQAGWNEYIHTGNTGEALELFKKAYNADPESMKAASSYSQLLIQIGHYKEAAEILTAAFAVCKWDKWCEPALADLEAVMDHLPVTENLCEVIKKRLMNPERSWIEEALLSELYAKLLRAKRDITGADKIYSGRNYLGQWLVLGPFSNRNQQEFLQTAKVEEGLNDLDLTAQWPGQGRNLNWQRIAVPVDGTINLGMALYPGEETIGYTLCYIKSEYKCKATLAIEQSGASAMWLNGELKYVDTAYVNNNSALQRLIEVELEAGVNQLFFKLASGNSPLSKIRLQVIPLAVGQLGASGSALLVSQSAGKLEVGVAPELAEAYNSSGNKISGAAAMPAIKQGDSWGTAGFMWGAISEFEDAVDAVQDDKDKDYNYALAAMNMGYLINHYGFDSTEREREKNYAMKLAADYPNCPLFLNSAAYVQQGDNYRRKMLQKAAAISPEEISAREGLMQLAVKGGFYNKAARIARTIAADSGWSFSIYNILGSIAERNGWAPEAKNYYKQALNYNYGQGWIYSREAANTPSLTEAIKILYVGSERVFDVDLAEALGGWLYKAGRFSEAKEIYADILRLNVYVEADWDSYAACCVAMGDYAGALDKLLSGLRWMPQSPFLRENAGRILLRMGQEQEGVKYLREALSLQKDNPDLTALVDEIASKEKDFYAADTVDYAVLAGKNITAEDFPQYDRIRLLDQNYITVADNGTQKRMVRKVIKVLRDSAVPTVSLESIFYDSSRQKVDLKHARVIQPNGEVSENPVIEDGMYSSNVGATGIYDSAQVKNIKLANVKEGSIVDIMYTIEDTAANFYHDEFSDIQYIGEVEPTIKFLYTVDIPTTMEAEAYIKGLDKKVQKTSLNDRMTKIRVELDNIAGVEPEPLMPPLEDIKPFIAVSTFKNWKDLAHWADGLFAPALALPDDIRSKVHEIVQGAETRDQKIAAIYNYVTRNIRYVSIAYGKFGYTPHKAERTFRAGYGDCKDTAVLLAAMLEEVGIEAYPTLVRARNLGALLSKLPSPELFNHSIAYVPAKNKDEKEYWLDGTTDFYLLGMIPAMDRGTESLIIRSGGELLQIPGFDPEQEMQISNAKIVLHADGSGSVTGRELYKGRSYIGITRSLEKPDAFFSMLKGFFNQRFAGVQITGLNYKVADAAPAAWFDYALDIRKLALQDAAALKILPWVFPINIANIAILKERRYDLVLGSPQIFETVVDIELKDDLQIMSDLPDVAIDSPAIAYIRKFERTPTGARISSRLILKESTITQQEYGQFRADINTIMARSREWLFVSK